MQAGRLVRSAVCTAISLTLQVLCLDLITLITPHRAPCTTQLHAFQQKLRHAFQQKLRRRV